MTQYLISFNDGAMDHIPAEEMPDVGKASHTVVQEAVNAGVWVYGGGLERQQASIVATDGTVTDGPYPETREVIGGFSVVDVATREQALAWAAKMAAACRCAQEVRELMPDPETDAMIRQAGSRGDSRRGLLEGTCHFRAALVMIRAWINSRHPSPCTSTAGST